MNLWVSGGEDGSKYSLDATLLPALPFYPFSTTRFLLLSRSGMPLPVPAKRGSIILRIAEFQFTLLVCLLSSLILEHGSKRKHPIDCVPGTPACHSSLPELRKGFSLQKRFIYQLKTIKKKKQSASFVAIKDCSMKLLRLSIKSINSINASGSCIGNQHIDKI